MTELLKNSINKLIIHLKILCSNFQAGTYFLDFLNLQDFLNRKSLSEISISNEISVM